ncbi:MAG: hydrolase [Ruminococcus sp.]|nr:hydrolase [Ruminococcus sp.]
MIYYTADLHLSHEAIIKYCGRPFETVEEMNEAIVSRWNEVVRRTDDVYILGDVIFRVKEDTPLYLDRMNGVKHLIVGNHDVKNLKKQRFAEMFATVDHYLVIRDQKRKVVLFHYPIVEWDGFFDGAYHIYGHIHNNDNQANRIMKNIPNAFNAGLDLNDFTPQTLSQLIERNKQPD